MLKNKTGLLLAAMVIFLLTMAVSCSPTAKALRDDQKALNRVNGNAKLQDSVMKRWFELNPKDPAPKVTVSAPKIIEVPIIKLVLDTGTRRKILDSLNAIAKNDSLDCKTAAEAAFDMGYEVAEKKYLAHPVKGECPPDTTKEYQSRAELNFANRRIIQLEKDEAVKNAVLSTKDLEIKDAQRDAGKKRLWIIGLSILSFLLLIVIGYLVFKGGFLSIFKK